MFVNFGNVDAYVADHVAQLIREAEHERLVNLALGPGRPFRLRLAEWLHSVAERLEGTPRQRKPRRRMVEAA